MKRKCHSNEEDSCNKKEWNFFLNKRFHSNEDDDGIKKLSRNYEGDNRKRSHSDDEKESVCIKKSRLEQDKPSQSKTSDNIIPKRSLGCDLDMSLPTNGCIQSPAAARSISVHITPYTPPPYSSPTTPRTPATPYSPHYGRRARYNNSTYTVNTAQLSPGSVWDSHCHLDFIARRMAREGVTDGEKLEVCLNQDKEPLGGLFGGCVANFCDPQDWAQGRHEREVSPILQSCQEQNKVYITLGCHPHFADKLSGNKLEQLERLARVSGHGRVVAIGECGLDRSKKNGVSIENQKKVFIAQVKLALKLNLPLVLHIREAEEEGRDVLRELEVPRDFQIHRHCFNGSLEEANSWMKLYPRSKLGLTGLVTFHKAKKVHEVARSIPLTRLLLETDAPYFLPSELSRDDYSYKFSHPGHVLHVAAKIASLRNINIEEVLSANRKNIKDIYGIKTEM